MTVNRGFVKFHCCNCGRFLSYSPPVDYGIYYGSYYHMEPPEPSEYCPKCANEMMQRAIKNPESVITDCWWIKPNYVSVAKSILRHRRRNYEYK